MLSYSVGYSVKKGHDPGWVVMAFELVGVRGLEPRTSSLSGKRSNRLSYTPKGAPREASAPAAATALLYRIPSPTRTVLGDRIPRLGR